MEVAPEVWRSLSVPSDYTLADLHDVLQLAMGWTNSHLHQFQLGSARYSPPDPEEEFYDSVPAADSAGLRLFEIFPKAGESLVYEYDFGDGWEHSVKALAIRPAIDGVAIPRCLAGVGACPPEDCGGAGGYEGFLEAIRDTEHPEHDEMLAWCGGVFDPSSFDLIEVNGLLAKYQRRRTSWLKRTGPRTQVGMARQEARIELLRGILEGRDRERAKRARTDARKHSRGWVLERRA
jgi:hypothetical protein